MNPEAFSVPRRQSVLGIALIFSTTVYKFLRGFWVLGAYLILKTPTGLTLFYVILGTVVLATAVLGYSILYYRNFLFHIDYRNEEFVLQKGVISTQNIAIPFDKIQQVYFKRSILERIINTYRVVIDTAGSNQDEVSITAITKEDADLLASILTRVKREIKIEEQEIAEVSPTRFWTYKLDALKLIKIGISTNYLRGLGLVAAFFATIYNEFSRFFSEEYSDEFGEYYDMVPSVSSSIGFFIAIFIFLLIVSIIITVLEVFIKYFGLKLTQTSESLELEMGLNTNTKVALQPRRVQLVQTITNPVQKYFNLYEARIALASSEDVIGKKKIKIPGLGSEELAKVKDYLYGEDLPNLKDQFKSHKLILFRKFFLSLIPAIISYLIFLWQPYLEGQIYFTLVIVYIAIAIIYQVIKYRSLKLVITNEFLHKFQGVWNKSEEQVEIYKMQGVTIKQPIWYRRRGLFNLEFHTAGGDVTFKAVNHNVFPWINYIMYKIESSRKRWM
jgi:putative membrane protein